MRSVYRYPSLYTLEGYPGSDFPVPGIRLSGAYTQQDTYREQNFAVLGADWGIFNFLRPSRMKTWAPAVAAGATAITAVAPNPITGVIAVGAGAASGVSSAIYQANRGGTSDPPNSGTGYKQSADKGVTDVEQKKVPWVPIAVAGGALLAAMAIS